MAIQQTSASLVLLGLLLAACGGGGGGSGSNAGGNNQQPIGEPLPNTQMSVSGSVIDGYVSGATVFLDLNYNGELDSEEPSAVSGNSGTYELEIDEEYFACVAYAPIVVDVPVGAIDEELGEVTEAYRMVRAPSFASVSEEDILNITPLTSLVWTAIEEELADELPNSSCEEFLSNATARLEIIETLDSATGDMVTRYNISEAQIYADFIQTEDADAKALATEIVRGLASSFAETRALEEEYPSALFVKVNYYVFDERDADDEFPESWYRSTNIFLEDEDTYILERVSDDLVAVEKLIIHENRTDASPEGMDEAFRLRQQFTFESRDGSEDYSCTATEQLTTEEGTEIEYELNNLRDNNTASTYEECLLTDFSSDTDTRYLFVNEKADTDFKAGQFIYQNSGTGIPILGDWVNLEENISSLDRADFINVMELLPYEFDDFTDSGTDSFFKQYEYQEGNQTIWLSRNSSNEYVRRTTHQDGTSTQECGTDGLSWGPCEQ